MELQEVKKKRKRTKIQLEKNSLAYLLEREKANARKKRFLDKMTEEERELKKARDRAYHQKKKAEKNRKIAAMSEEEKQRQREVWSRAAKKYRQKKKTLSNIGNKSPPHGDEKIAATSSTKGMVHGSIVQKVKAEASPPTSQQEETLAKIEPKEETVEKKLSGKVIKREMENDQDQTKLIIAKVYHYFEQEYEELKKTIEEIDQTPLSMFRQRTALATGVSETTVLEILEEEARRNEELRQDILQKQSLARKRPRQTDSSSEDGDSDENNDFDDEQPGAVDEAETLVIKEEPLEPYNEEPEIYVELPNVKEEPDVSGENKDLTDPISIDLKTEPRTEEATTIQTTREISDIKIDSHNDPDTSDSTQIVGVRSDSHRNCQRRYYERNREEINKRKRDSRMKLNTSHSISATAAERNRIYRQRNRQRINKKRRESRQLQRNVHSNATPAVKCASKSKVRKTQQKTDTSPATTTPPTASASPATSVPPTSSGPIREMRRAKPRSIGGHTKEGMKEALKQIRSGTSVRKAAKLSGIPISTLRRYNLKSKASQDLETLRLVPNYEVNKIFSEEQEKKLISRFKQCSSSFHGLTEKESRRVAYKMAEANHIKMPENWRKNQMAGKEWLRSFRRRHPELSLRKLGRSRSTKPHNKKKNKC